jgi:hypothetical protein
VSQVRQSREPTNLVEFGAASGALLPQEVVKAIALSPRG